MKKKSLTGKEIIVGVTGSIAAYKACELVSALRKMEAVVSVILTENAKKFVTPLSLQSLSGGRVYDDYFNLDDWSDKHIGLAQKADIVVIAPASADFIARSAAGRASDLLSATLLTAKKPVIIVPAMNCGMYEHPLTQQNIKTLKKIGYHILGPDKGLLACGQEGIGRMVDVSRIISSIENYIS